MKKENLAKKESPPKVLVPGHSISVQVDPKSPQTKKFLQEKIIKSLAQKYPLRQDEGINLEFNLEGCEPRVVRTLRKKIGDKDYYSYKELFFSEPERKILHDNLLAILNHVEDFLKKSGCEISPKREIDTNLKKFTLGILVRDPEKINDILEEYLAKKRWTNFISKLLCCLIIFIIIAIYLLL
ncbi:hypothetical protein LR007_03655 [candidate division NPL-UPA2 bacterium]|nr:hypothetical protein [candidate division NPL-UPA2 bacterium]